MLTLFTAVITNYFTMLDSFIGIDYIIALCVVVIAFGYIYSLLHYSKL